MTPPRPKRLLLGAQVATYLIGEIVAGNPAPGEFLESEQRLAEEHGVSRTVMREALILLSTKGLISIRHGRGAIVQPRPSWDIFDPAVIDALNASGGVVPILQDLLETRMFFEVEVAGLAALRAGPTAAERLFEHIAEMRNALDDPGEYFRLDIAFHQQLLIATGNQVLLRLLDPVKDLLAAAREHVVSISSRQSLEASIEGHVKIAEAVRIGDADAARTAMVEHLKLTETDLRLAGEHLGPSARDDGNDSHRPIDSNV